MNTKIAAKQLEAQSRRAEKDEKKEKEKVRKAIEKGNKEGAQIYAQNAIRKKHEAINYLKLASKMDAVASRLDSAEKSQQMTRQVLKDGEAAARAHIKENLKKSGRARVCDFCNKRSETKLRACGKCKFVFYCGADCQRKAWPTHKQDCGSALDRLCVALERNASTIDTQHAAEQVRANEIDDARRAAQN